MVKTKSSNLKNISLKYGKKEFLDIFIITLGLGVLITSIIFITGDLFIETNSLNLKYAYEDFLNSGPPTTLHEENNIYSTAFMRSIVYYIITLSILLTILYSLRFFKITNKYIYIGKIFLSLLLLIFISLLLPGYYYINKIEKDIHPVFKDIDQAEKSGLALIILSFILGITSIASLIFLKM